MSTPTTLDLTSDDPCGIGSPMEYLKDWAPAALLAHVAGLLKFGYPDASDIKRALEWVEEAEPGDPEHYSGPEGDLEALRDGLSNIQYHDSGDCDCWDLVKSYFVNDVDEICSAASTERDEHFLLVQPYGGLELYDHVQSPFDLDDIMRVLKVRSLSEASLSWDPESATLSGHLDRTSFTLTRLAEDRQAVIDEIESHPLTDSYEFGETVWRVHTLPADKLAAGLDLADSLDPDSPHDLNKCLATAAEHGPWSHDEATLIAAIAPDSYRDDLADTIAAARVVAA